MHPLDLIIPGILVLVIGGWPGAIVGLFVGWRRKRPLVGVLCGLSGGLFGAIAAFVLWAVIASLIVPQLPLHESRDEWGRHYGIGATANNWLGASFLSVVLLGSAALGWFASAAGAKDKGGNRHGEV